MHPSERAELRGLYIYIYNIICVELGGSWEGVWRELGRELGRDFGPVLPALSCPAVPALLALPSRASELSKTLQDPSSSLLDPNMSVSGSQLDSRNGGKIEVFGRPRQYLC